MVSGGGGLGEKTTPLTKFSALPLAFNRQLLAVRTILYRSTKQCKALLYTSVTRGQPRRRVAEI